MTTIPVNVSEWVHLKGEFAAPIAATLSEGWYAFCMEQMRGANAFDAKYVEDASGLSVGIPAQNSSNTCDNGTQALMITGNAGSNQNLAPHMFIKGTPAPPLTSDVATCLSILREDPAATSGVYIIDPDGTGGLPPFDARCDMDLNGGGWTVLMDGDTLDEVYTTAAVNPGGGGKWKTLG